MAVSPGQPIPRSAALWNNIIESATDYAQRHRLGEGGGSQSLPNPTDTIKIKNSSGGHIRAGEVLEITGFLLGNVRRTELWFDGDTPDATHPFAIALQDIPSTSIDRAQVSGVCVALVNVTNAAHGYAYVKDTEIVAQSAVTGPLRILHKPTGTGEKTCAVLFEFGGGGGNNCVATTDTIIPKREGVTAGGPIGCITYRLEAGTLTAGETVQVWSWISSDSSDPAVEEDEILWIFIEQDAAGVWWFTGQDCPSGMSE